MVEDWVWDEEMQCRHVTQESCFQTMTTVYKTVRVRTNNRVVSMLIVLNCKHKINISTYM